MHMLLLWMLNCCQNILKTIDVCILFKWMMCHQNLLVWANHFNKIEQRLHNALCCCYECCIVVKILLKTIDIFFRCLLVWPRVFDIQKWINIRNGYTSSCVHALFVIAAHSNVCQILVWAWLDRYLTHIMRN